jgi:hypothetical protein
MNLKMNFSWKKCVKKVQSINYCECYFKFLGEKNRWLIFIALLAMAGFCGHIWYEYAYNPNWNEEQKKSYMNSKEKEAVFNKSKFDKVIAIQEKRRNNYENKAEDIQDIFKLGEREVK